MAHENVRRIFRRSKQPQHVTARTTVFKINRADSDTSRQIAFNDEFLGLAGALGATILLPTPYNVDRLFEIINQSNMVQQCVDAYVTNTVLAGWEVGPAHRGKEVDEGERVELESFIDHANTDESLSMAMAKVIRDRESVGFGFLEVIRDASDALSLFRHCPALWTRLCAKDTTEVLVENVIQRGRRVTTVKEWRKFRRFVQIVNGQQVWFKEFGDPRKMDWRNGAFEMQSGFSAEFPATEVYHFKLPSNEPYGVPKWINQLPSVLGSREAEEVNMRYFQDNTVPPMLLLVGNGRLTQQSYRELTRALNEEDLGSKRQNKMMLLEAVGEGDSMDGKNSAIELKVEKLTDARQSDGLFKEYDQANMAKVRSSFRLPPITVGMSQDVNFATASTSAFVAESQVFMPARNDIDETLNNQFVQGNRGMRLKSCKLLSRTPSITSPEMVMKAMTALNVMGAMTPRSAQVAANKLLQMEITPYPEKGSKDWEEWMDKPIQIGIKETFTPADPAVLAAQEKATEVAASMAQEDPANPANTHGAQAGKDASTKAVEKGGDIGAKQPKHGQE